jgi:hypothetical protein
LGSRFRGSRFKVQGSDLGFRISDFGLRISDFRCEPKAIESNEPGLGAFAPPELVCCCCFAFMPVWDVTQLLVSTETKKGQCEECNVMYSEGEIWFDLV